MAFLTYKLQLYIESFSVTFDVLTSQSGLEKVRVQLQVSDGRVWRVASFDASSFYCLDF